MVATAVASTLLLGMEVIKVVLRARRAASAKPARAPERLSAREAA
jgi:hypothetical protein